MDGTRFDSVIRSLATRASRRTMLHAAAGVLTASLAGLSMMAPGVAKRRKKTCKKKCGPCKRCKKGKCKPKPDGADCGGPCLECLGGACQAKTGEPCGEGHVCLTNGSCAQECPGGNADCPPQACGCSSPGSGPPFVCIENVGCDNIPVTCSSLEPCPQGYACVLTICNGGSKRCMPLCPL